MTVTRAAAARDSVAFAPNFGSDLLHAGHLQLLLRVRLVQLLHLLLQPHTVVFTALFVEFKQHDGGLCLLQAECRVLQLLLA